MIGAELHVLIAADPIDFGKSYTNSLFASRFKVIISGFDPNDFSDWLSGSTPTV